MAVLGLLASVLALGGCGERDGRNDGGSGNAAQKNAPADAYAVASVYLLMRAVGEAALLVPEQADGFVSGAIVPL